MASAKKSAIETMRLGVVYKQMGWTKVVENLQYFQSAAAPFGGPIVLLSRNFRVGTSSAARPIKQLVFYSAAGKEIWKTDWPAGNSECIGLQWSDSEVLYAIAKNGVVWKIPIYGDCISFAHIGGNSHDELLVDTVSMYPQGIAALMASSAGFRLFSVAFDDTADSGTIMEYMRPAIDDVHFPTAMGFMPASKNSNGSPEVLITLWDEKEGASLLVTDKHNTWATLLYKQKPASAKPICKIAVDPTGMWVACVSENGSVAIFSADWSMHLVHFVGNAPKPPRDAVWCGSDFAKTPTLVVCWGAPFSKLMVCAHAGQFKWLPLVMPGSKRPAGELIVVSESDGVRVLSRTTSWMLRHQSLSAPARTLLLAANAGGQKGKLAVQRMFDENSLQQGITDVMAAAAAQFDKHGSQNIFIIAASHAQRLLEGYRQHHQQHHLNNASNRAFVEACKLLRVLNGLRDVHAAGMPLTKEQYEYLGEEVVLSRLIKRRLYGLALQLCEYMQRREFKQVAKMQWAKEFILAFGNNTDTQPLKEDPGSHGEGSASTPDARAALLGFGKALKGLGKEPLALPFKGSPEPETEPPPLDPEYVRRLEAEKSLFDKVVGRVETKTDQNAMARARREGRFKLFAHCAVAAYEQNCKHIAEALNAKEPIAAQRVAAKLLMREYQDALREAVELQDIQLSFAVLDHLFQLQNQGKLDACSIESTVDKVLGAREMHRQFLLQCVGPVEQPVIPSILAFIRKRLRVDNSSEARPPSLPVSDLDATEDFTADAEAASNPFPDPGHRAAQRSPNPFGAKSNPFGTARASPNPFGAGGGGTPDPSPNPFGGGGTPDPSPNPFGGGGGGTVPEASNPFGAGNSNPFGGSGAGSPPAAAAANPFGGGESNPFARPHGGNTPTESSESEATPRDGEGRNPFSAPANPNPFQKSNPFDPTNGDSWRPSPTGDDNPFSSSSNSDNPFSKSSSNSSPQPQRALEGAPAAATDNPFARQKSTDSWHASAAADDGGSDMESPPAREISAADEHASAGPDQHMVKELGRAYNLLAMHEEHRESASLMLRFAAQLDPNQYLNEKLACLKAAVKCLAQDGADAEVEIINSQIFLLEEQNKLCPILLGHCVNETLSMALFYAYKNPQQHPSALELAEKVKEHVRLPILEWSSLQIRALAKAKDWAGLEKLSMQKAHKQLFTAPAEEFVEACIEENEPGQAMKFLPKVKDRKKRLELALKLGDWELATPLAVELRDDQAMRVVMQQPNLSPKSRQLIQNKLQGIPNKSGLTGVGSFLGSLRSQMESSGERIKNDFLRKTSKLGRR